MPEWITQRLTLEDKGVIQAVTNVVDGSVVSISLVRFERYLDMQVLMRQVISDLFSYELIYLYRQEALIGSLMSHAISTYNPGLSAEEASSAMATAMLSGGKFEKLSSLFMECASDCWTAGRSDDPPSGVMGSS
jgi:hypothetical protein